MSAFRRRAARPAFAVTGLAVAMLALTACGGGAAASSDATTAEPAVTTSASPQASGGAGGGGAQNGGAGGDFGAAIEKYRSCLADNGVTLPSFDPGQGGTPPSGMPTSMPSGMPTDMPSGGPGGGGPSGGFPGGGFNQKPDDVEQATWDAAVKACADVAPSFGPGMGGPGGGQPDETALAAFKNCLGDHDVTVADDDNWFRELDRNDATVAAAIQTCQPLLPQNGAAGNGGAAASPATTASS